MLPLLVGQGDCLRSAPKPGQLTKFSVSVELIPYFTSNIRGAEIVVLTLLQSSALRASAQLVASGGASGLKSKAAAMRIASITGVVAPNGGKRRGSLGGSSAGVDNPIAIKRDTNGMIGNPLLRMNQGKVKAI